MKRIIGVSILCCSVMLSKTAQSQELSIGGSYQTYFDQLSDEPFLNLNVGYSHAQFDIGTFYSHCVTTSARSFQSLGLRTNYRFFPTEARGNLFVHAEISTQIAGQRVGKPVQYDDYSISSGNDYYGDQFLKSNYQSLLGLGGCVKLGQFELNAIYGITYRKWSVYNGSPSSNQKSQSVSGSGISVGMNYMIPIKKN